LLFPRRHKPERQCQHIQGCWILSSCNTKFNIFSVYGKKRGIQDFPEICKGIARDFSIQLNGSAPRGHRSTKQSNQRFVHSKLGKPSSIYKYTDEAGKTVYCNCRFDLSGGKKTFRQCQADGLTWTVKGIKPLPYNLTNLIDSPYIFSTEGEKDAENLIAIGEPATTHSGGAGGWKPELAEYFKGKTVYILPDNDYPGKKMAKTIAGDLYGTAKEIKIVELPDLPEKGDVSDFIARFDNPDDAATELSNHVNQAEKFIPPKKITQDDAIMSISQFCKLELPERKQYLCPFATDSSIGVGVGHRGIGKTFVALGMLDAMSRGSSFGPWKCKQSVPLLLLDGEMPPQDIIERSSGMGINDQRANPFYIYSDAWATQNGLKRANLTDATWRDEIKQLLKSRDIKFWVIDNLASLTPGIDENSKQDWDPINQWLIDLRFSGIATLMLHHTNKEGHQRGTSAREDNLDYSFILKAPPNYTPEDGARFIMHFTKSRVRTKDLKLISDTEFKLTLDESNRYVWTYGSVKQERRLEVLRLLDEGMKQIDIADALQITRGAISKIRSRAVKDGHLTPKNKLTQSGFLMVDAP
jgi:AAA domain/Homeodomain-like domain